MKLTFCGAAREVTGSMYLLTLDNGYKILIDCGLNLRRDISRQDDFPFDPQSLNLVLLTHAHVDHSGRLPELVEKGYAGQIVSTTPSWELCKLLLEDSALLISKKLKRLKNRLYRYHARQEEVSMLLQHHVARAIERFVSLEYNRRFEVTKGVFITFIPVGHLLGAASIFIEVEEGGLTKSILFSGDIGRKNYPLLKDPQVSPQADYLVCESTYGNRSHQDNHNPESFVLDVIKRTCVERPGRLIIPAFSVGRTQSILYTLHKLQIKGLLPPIKIFTDSPMAEQSSIIYNNFVSTLNDEARALFDKHGNLFDFDNLRYVANFKESKAISNFYEPCIIISASGMLSGGRMQIHIKKNLPNPYCTFLLIGYSAEGTPGHDLMHGKKSLRIEGREYPVMAEILKTDLYSGHAGQEDLLGFVKNQSKNKLKKVFLVHGDYDAMDYFKDKIIEAGYHDVYCPELNDTVEL